jgi:hypothetical protein
MLSDMSSDVSSPGAAGCAVRWILEMQPERSLKYNSPIMVGRWPAAQMDESLYKTTPSSASRIFIVGSHLDNLDIFLVGRCFNLKIYCLV